MNSFLASIFAATPGVGNSSIDLIIILLSLGLLTCLIYLLKSPLERLRNSVNHTIFPDSESVGEHSEKKG